MNLDEYEQQKKTFVIAEIAQAHDGSVGILHSLIEAAANTGVDAVKFQVHIAHAESSNLEPFRVKFSHVDATRFDYWKRMELSLDQWKSIKQHCDELSVEFLATPFSNEAVDLLEEVGVQRYKVGSGDAANLLLLEKIAKTGKEIILSTGLGSLEELDQSVEFLNSFKVPVSVMQCTTKYPTAAEDVGLEWMARFRDRYQCPVGLSDHSGEIFAGIAATALGASVIEAHITFDKRMFGPDAKASLTIDGFAELVRGIRFAEKALGSGPEKTLDENKQDLRRMFGKALAVNSDLEKDHIISFEDLEGKKPADAGIDVNSYTNIVGKKLKTQKKRGDFLTHNDINYDKRWIK